MAIDSSLLVGDDVEPPQPPPSTPISESTPSDIKEQKLDLRVYDEADEDITINENHVSSVDNSIQTEPLTSLPCSNCVVNDVRLHPAVAAGVVSLDLASVFIPDAATANKTTTKKRKTRSKPEARWLTSDMELKRRRQESEKIKEQEETKRRREETKKQRKEQMQIEQ